MSSFLHVPFWFLSSDEEAELPGTVHDRSDTMILEVGEAGTPDAYYIEARQRGGFFEGSDRDGLVHARWAPIGDGIYVGIWAEDRKQYLFSFDVSDTARLRARKDLSPDGDAMNYRLPGSFGSSKRR